MLMVVSILPAGMITAQAASEQAAMWFMNDMKFTQEPGGNFSHKGTQNFDVVGVNSNNIFAPFDCKIVAIYTSWGSGNTVIIESTSKVRYANGTYDYMCMAFAHDNDISNLYVGKTIKQGEVFYQTGTYGDVTARHSHVTCIKGKYKWDFWTKNQYNNYSSPNGINPVNALYIKSSTKVYNSAGLKFKIYNPLVKPDCPKITSNVSGDIAANSNVTVTWSGVSGASSYIVKVNGKQVQDNSSTKYAFTAGAQKYEITVSAKNSAGTSGTSNKITVTGHNPSTVTFKDYDGTILNEQIVKYGEAAVSPSPVREGYTFTGWDKSYSKITADTVITAQYKINTYTVKFLDKDGNLLSVQKDGNLLSTQKVDYGSSATEPENKNVPPGFKFLGWDIQDYKSVKSNLTVRGIYAWGNTDLPIVITNMRAERQNDGYYVYFDLTNFPDEITRGRAVVSLKTADGKLVDTTESSAFSIPKNGTKTGMEVFIPCDKTATTAEIEIVRTYSSGVPISQSVSASIDNGKMWSTWLTEKPDEGTYSNIEERTEYRYRVKEITTGNTKTKEGYIYDGTYTTSVGNWSNWQDSSISAFTNESKKREVKTQTVPASYKTTYHYYRYAYQQYGGVTYSYKENGTQKYNYTSSSQLAYYNDYGGGTYKYWYNNNQNFFPVLKSSPFTTSSVSSYKTQYSYRDTTYTYNFYRWGNWSDWSKDLSISANDNTEVEQRTVYRIMSTDIGNEDTSGDVRTTSGTLDSSYAGKQATLFVYKVDEASDYSNEYVGQTTIGEDGSYSFTYKLREEPTEKTGDFTIALGIEGTTNTMVIGTIEAPKPKYTVKFLSKDGATLLDTQTVTEGKSATVPEAPEVEGYTFVGWSEKTTNIKEDVEITALYKENTYTVVFVDWVQESVAVREFTYGSVITPPETTKIEGYDFSGWDGITSDTIATQNMVVTAKYDKETYTVKFFDFDGNVISTQTVEYKDSATEPELTVNDNMTFLGWGNPAHSSDYYEVTDNLELYPQYVFKETTAAPTADVESGEYTSVQTVTLSCETEDALIYYTTDGTDPSDSRIAKLYTEPITIKTSCKLQYIAVSMERNDSKVKSNYYCINNPSVKTDWMLYSELPNEVKNSISDYDLESDTGYRYKNVSSTGLVLEATRLTSEGWTYMGKGYSAYTSWQDDPIEIDDSYIDFEVDTQQVTDTSKTWYRYSHYKYTDDLGNIVYSPTAVDGYDCEYEEITLENRLNIAGFTDDSISYYNYNNQQWFTQTKVNGLKTQYRSRYTINSYYKWTSWDIESPSSNETRDYETDTVYRYSNKNHYIVIIPNLGDAGTTLIMRENDTIDISPYNNIKGYEFDGLYLNEDFTSKYDLSTPVTESLTLYAKYTPKQYTVIFQMQDGTELDTQTVEYLTPAVAPETDSVPGYVFAGWDKEFDCITEDTVITGRYFKTSEYTMVSLDKNNATLFAGSSLQLNLTITPVDLASEEVEWTSSNPSVVSVNETGLVTAVGAGVATISVRAVKTNHTATCNVTVLADQSNTIVLNTNSYLDYDELGYLRRITQGSSVNEIMSQFQNNSLEFLGLNGEKLLPTDKVGTGTKINLCKDGEIIDTNTVIVTADMTGDGIISNRDVVMFNKYQVQKITPEECQILAMDVNGDGYVNNKDAAMVARYLVGKETL